MSRQDVLFKPKHWWDSLAFEEKICLVKNLKMDKQLRIKRKIQLNYAIGLDELFDAYWPDYKVNTDISISTIQEICKLKYISLAKTNLKSVEFLQPLYLVEQLYINDTWIDKIHVVKNFTKLRKFNCSTTPIKNFTPLRSLTWVNELNLAYTEFDDVSVLKGYGHLKYLDLYKSALEETKGFGHLKNLEFLSLDGCPVKNLWGLYGLSNLKTLYCGSTNIKDLYPLGTLINLKRLDISHTKIRSLESVYGHPKLQFIKCNDTLLNEVDIQNCRKFIETISDKEIDFPYPSSEVLEHINRVIQKEIEKVRRDIRNNDDD